MGLLNEKSCHVAEACGGHVTDLEWMRREQAPGLPEWLVSGHHSPWHSAVWDGKASGWFLVTSPSLPQVRLQEGAHGVQRCSQTCSPSPRGTTALLDSHHLAAPCGVRKGSVLFD